MKRFISLNIIVFIIFLTGCACQGIKNPVIRRANSSFLPNPITVYIKDNQIITEPQPGYLKKSLPVSNIYQRIPGCYIACYSRNGQDLKGLIRLNGLYLSRTCQPQGYYFKDLSAEPSFQELCQKRIAACGNNCWASGDTGGFLGVS